MTLELCRTIPIPTFEGKQGILSVLECEKLLPFSIKRFFFIYHIPINTCRGSHAHRLDHEFVIALSGNFNILLSDGKNEKNFKLDNPNIGLYVTPLIWIELDSSSPGSIIFVAASTLYDAKDYIYDKNELMALRNLK